jgi:serine/threonine protein kinase
MVRLLLLILTSRIVLYSLESCSWKISDFGLTVSATSKRLITTDEAKGTEGYRAPELINKHKFNNKVDIWSIGCIIYELLTEERAFKGDYEVLKWTVDKRKTIPLEVIPDDGPRELLSQFLITCLKFNPNERPTAQRICDLLGLYLGLSPGSQMNEDDLPTTRSDGNHSPAGTDIIFIRLLICRLADIGGRDRSGLN